MRPRSILPGGGRRGFLAGGRKTLSWFPASSDRFLAERGTGCARTKASLSGGFQACAGLEMGGPAKEAESGDWPLVREAATPTTD